MTAQKSKQLRLFLDSNVLTGGIIARWGLDRAILSLCAARICHLVLADAVRDEVEGNQGNLLLHATSPEAGESEALLDDYTTLIAPARPETVPYPSKADVLASRRLSRGLSERSERYPRARATMGFLAPRK